MTPNVVIKTNYRRKPPQNFEAFLMDIRNLNNVPIIKQHKNSETMIYVS